MFGPTRFHNFRFKLQSQHRRHEPAHALVQERLPGAAVPQPARQAVQAQRRVRRAAVPPASVHTDAYCSFVSLLFFLVITDFKKLENLNLILLRDYSEIMSLF